MCMIPGQASVLIALPFAEYDNVTTMVLGPAEPLG